VCEVWERRGGYGTEAVRQDYGRVMTTRPLLRSLVYKEKKEDA